jgi:hypothetical protein
VGVTNLVHPDSFIPLTRDSHSRVLTGHAVIEKQSPGSAAVALTSQTPQLVALLERYSADPNMLSHTYGVALPPRLSFPLCPAAQKGRG